MPRFLPVCVIAILFVVFAPPSVLAANADRFQFNHDIQIQPDEKVGDVTCLNCSIRVLGRISGDVTAIHGSIVVQPGAAISGDVTAVGGSARVESGTQIAGDVTAIAGNVRRDPQATVSGDVTSLGGGAWILLIFLVPFAVLGGIVALIIWLIQRSRQPTPVPAYTLRRN
jgi:hypothetical protein